MGALQVARYSSFESLEARQDDWNMLAERGATSSVFQTYPWLACWWRNFGDKHELLLLAAEQDDSLVGVAPLMISNSKPFGRRTIEFISAPWGGDYCDFIYPASRLDVLEQFMTWLHDHRQLWDMLWLANIPETSTTLKSWPEAARRWRYPSRVEQLDPAPTRLFNDPPEDHKLPQKKSLKRSCNWFSRQGRLEFKNVQDLQELEGYLDAFFQQHIERRSLTEEPSQFLNAQDQQFYRDLVRAMRDPGWLVFSVVLFEGKPIAFHLGFEFANRFIWYKPTFDVHWARRSPGEVLIKHLFEYALSRGVAEFDFTIGNEAFKHRYANLTRRNYGIRTYASSLAYTGESAWLKTKASLKKLLRREA